MVTEESTLLETLEIFFENCQISFFKKRSIILQPSDMPSSVFYIKSGYIRVYRNTEDGEELTLTILKPRDVFPLTYALHTQSNPYFLEALTPLEVWSAPQEKFLQFIKADYKIFFALTTNIFSRFTDVLTRMEYLVYSSAYIKVATILFMCAKRFGVTEGKNIIVQIPLTHHDLATLTGITRETTSLEMKKLEKQGFVGRFGRHLLVKNVDELEEQIYFCTHEKALLNNSL